MSTEWRGSAPDRPPIDGSREPRETGTCDSPPEQTRTRDSPHERRPWRSTPCSRRPAWSRAQPSRVGLLPADFGEGGGSTERTALRTTGEFAALEGNTGTAFDEFYLAETITYLPEPDSGAAVGLTSKGWHYYPDGGDDWELALDYMGNNREPLDGVIAERLNQRRYPSNRAESGSGTPDDPHTVSGVLNRGKLYVFDAGYYETPGLSPDPDIDHEETAVYLEGDGIRTTTLSSDGTDRPLYDLDVDGTGNFGGISDMTMYGAGAGETPTEPLVHVHGAIDQLIENVILRYSGGDLLRVDDSASGLRLRNSWIENTTGYGVRTTYGTRAKLSDLHVVSCTEGGISTLLSNSQFDNISVQNCPTGIEFGEGKNQLSNAYLRDAGNVGMATNGQFSCLSNVLGRENGTTLDVNSPFTAVSNLISMFTEEQALTVRDDYSTFNNVVVFSFGGDSDSRYCLDVRGDGNTVSQVTCYQSGSDGRYASRNLLRIDGDRNVVDGLHAVGPDEPWHVTVAPGSTENTLRGVKNVSLDEFDDGGVRTLFNGRGTNDGDPSTEGEWHGHADYAAAQNALVEDTSGGGLYRALSDGSWIAV